MSGQVDLYAKLGVDSGKEGVRATFSGAIDNDFPGAWVNIVCCPWDHSEVFTQHMDGDGSKGLQRLLMYALTGDITIIDGMVDDGVSMNTGDIAAAGFVDLQMWTDVLNINGLNIPYKSQVLERIKQRFCELRDLYRRYGFQVYWLGGETADLPHQVQTQTFDVAVHARAYESDIVRGNIQPGDRIWGFSSAGQAVWETAPNSGIMSNGLTLARTCLMNAEYGRQFPELLLSGAQYTGRFHIGDVPTLLQGMTVGEAITSPTRQWAILVRLLIGKLKDERKFHLLHGISMNTGGGATKVSNLGTGGILYQKAMPPVPPIFRLIQSESGQPWQHMYRSFNCGVGLDIVGDPALLPYLLAVKAETDVALFDLGSCLAHADPTKNAVLLATEQGTFLY